MSSTSAGLGIFGKGAASSYVSPPVLLAKRSDKSHVRRARAAQSTAQRAKRTVFP